MSAQNVERNFGSSHSRLPPLETRVLTEKERYYAKVMGTLDRLKIFRPSNGNSESLSKQVKPDQISDCSPAASEFLGRGRQYQVYVKYSEEYRVVGVKNPANDKEVIFRLSKEYDGKSGEITVVTGIRVKDNFFELKGTHTGDTGVDKDKRGGVSESDLLPIIKKSFY